jgi:translation initiation factor 1 (eIF-1/SUI1)
MTGRGEFLPTLSNFPCLFINIFTRQITIQMFHFIQANAWEAPYIGVILVVLLVGLAVWSKIDDGISKTKQTQLNQNLKKTHNVEEVVEKPVKVNEPHKSTLFFSTNDVDLDKLAKELKKRISRYTAFNELSIFIDGIDKEEMLGIEYYEYAKYFRETFSENANYTKGFQIDHIRPASRAITIDELKSFLHYTNTRAETKLRNEEKSNLFEYEYFYKCLDQKRHYKKEDFFKFFGYTPKSKTYDKFKDNNDVLFNLDYRFDQRYNSAEKYLRYNLLTEKEKKFKLEFHRKAHEEYVYDVTKNEKVIKQLYRQPTEEELKWKPENYIYPKPEAYSWEIRQHVTLNTLNNFNRHFHNKILEDPSEYLKLREELLSNEVITEDDFKKALIDFGYL